MTNNISMSAHDDKNFVSKNPSFSFNSKPMDVEETIVCLKKIVFAIGVVDTDDAPWDANIFVNFRQKIELELLG